VDTLVWPSLFNDFIFEQELTLAIEPIDFHHDVLGLWQDPAAMFQIGYLPAGIRLRKKRE
jgi:hypothetical protein